MNQFIHCNCRGDSIKLYMLQVLFKSPLLPISGSLYMFPVNFKVKLNVFSILIPSFMCPFFVLLCRLIEKSISSAYEIVCETKFQNCGFSITAHEAVEAADSSTTRLPILLPKELFEMLACAGPYMYRNTLLLQKVTIVICLCS